MDEIKILKVRIQQMISVAQDLDKKLDHITQEMCEHEFKKEIPCGMRDNGEFYYRCRKCGFSK